MHKRKFLRRWGRPVLLVVHWLALILSVGAGAVARMELGAATIPVAGQIATNETASSHSGLAKALRPQFKKVQENGFWFLPLCTIIAAMSLAMRGSLLPSATERAVKALLDDFRRNAFPAINDEMQYRVTLFRHAWSFTSPFGWLKWKMPWHGWLVPFERSGIFTLNTKVRFFAPLDAPDQCEGFAGRVYATGGCQYVFDLPELRAGQVSPPQGTLERYAGSTNVPVNWVTKRMKRGQTFPRSLWGIPIEVGGQRWGVLVVDSRNSRIRNHDNLKEEFETIGLCLNRLLSNRQD
ncbi:hypothetical protein [Prosthecobacter sp.]|uniref:hypothetical protein n=1 Tax=Prosthecobacter sp. TaxID=1965333 RepID=UPI002ABC66B0|nr:hypothetical protein [Prosthecobacter sp.]MDZ4406181.1 hypothetical protein [Prosthecobacter sp.]